jgi:eukaryotic-like serine/threonine-protein kinase
MTQSGSESSDSIGRTLGGHYRLELLLGQGGMGSVYRGVQLSVNRPVAIKLISGSSPNQDEMIRRFRREAEATARLSHPNTVRLFDFGVTESQELYMVMELLEGSDLAGHLQQTGPLAVQEALGIASQVLQALSEAHELGIVHRDLKPGNVFLSRLRGGGNFVKVMDFGIAGIEQARETQKLTTPGAVMGTPSYMSPEQAQGKPVDARSDLYSLGVMLFEMLTGHSPYDADTVVSLLFAHVTQPHKLLAQVGARLPEHAAVQPLLDHLLAKTPDARPPSAAAVLAQIEALGFAPGPKLEQTAPRRIVTVTANPETPLGWPMPDVTPKPAPIAAAPTSSRLGLAVTLASVLIAALGLVLWIKLPSRHDPRAAGVSAAAPQAQPTAAAPTAPTPAASAQPASAQPAAAAAEPAAHGDTPAQTPQAAEPAASAAPPVLAPEHENLRGARLRGKLGWTHPNARLGGLHGQHQPLELRPMVAAPEARAPSNEPSPPPTAEPAQQAPRPEPVAFSGALPFASISAAQRAYNSGRLSAAQYENAVGLLKARRSQRIDIEKANLERGNINAQEYEWRLGRIDSEFRGQ